MSQTSKEAEPQSRARTVWNYIPTPPVTYAPFWNWPPSLTEILTYFIRSWSPKSERFFVLLAAIAVWFWFTPSLDRTATFRFDWMAEIWLRNFILISVVAGGLHLWFYTFRKQGEDLHYDSKPLRKNSNVFHFGNQVWDNMFWTLSFGVLSATFWECLVLWAFSNGYATMISFTDNPVWFILLLIIVPMWNGFYFYWIHRLLHTKYLYRWVHSWHHKNINTGPWSGLANHPVEAFGLWGDAFLYLLVSCHPIHLLFNLLLHSISAPFGHCGYDKLKLSDKVSIQAGDFMHQLHHKFVDCNYGTLEMPWDKWFGSLHDGTPQGDAMMKERRKLQARTRVKSGK